MSDEQDKTLTWAKDTSSGIPADKFREVCETHAQAKNRANGIGVSQAPEVPEGAVIEFPIRAPAEAALVAELKAAAYQYIGRMTVAQCIGCFHIALQEIQEEQS